MVLVLNDSGVSWQDKILSENINRKGRRNLEVKVFDNDVEKALKILKNKLSKSGLFKELKLRRAY